MYYIRKVHIKLLWEYNNSWTLHEMTSLLLGGRKTCNNVYNCTVIRVPYDTLILPTFNLFKAVPPGDFVDGKDVILDIQSNTTGPMSKAVNVSLAAIDLFAQNLTQALMSVFSIPTTSGHNSLRHAGLQPNTIRTLMLAKQHLRLACNAITLVLL
ncbi:uncharacterized protein HD556DRAFT_1310503 [Suillus plorans]|uniref:Uncharacterized protein n=1 Tax=Suillus plorans TaxID=116603 RepID=A0A9P7DF90_9AGAM|nr:uncharacterized protein HD556DRAFT_1310503 [Suillus plorans]KAG1790484.1 hypothetical protein HD556DRAFT_1310503 [Suillus plorans]